MEPWIPNWANEKMRTWWVSRVAKSIGIHELGVSRRSDCRIFKIEISEVMDLLVVSMSRIKMFELLSKEGWRRRR